MAQKARSACSKAPQCDSSSKGRALIIYNESFRNGNEFAKDLQEMQNLWKGLGCDVETRTYTEKQELQNEVEKFSKEGNKADFYVLMILSLGEQEGTKVEKRGLTDLQYIVDTIAKSTRMTGKKKLIFFQMCLTTGKSDEQVNDWIEIVLERALHDRNFGVIETDRTAKDLETKDVMLALATQPDICPANGGGRWFLQSIKTAFTENIDNKDITEIMEKVMEEFEQRKSDAAEPARNTGVCMAYNHTFARGSLFP